MKKGDEGMNGIWEMKKFVGDEVMEGFSLPERLKLPLRCSVMARTRDSVTDIRDNHIYDGITSTGT